MMVHRSFGSPRARIDSWRRARPKDAPAVPALEELHTVRGHLDQNNIQNGGSRAQVSGEKGMKIAGEEQAAEM